MCPQGTKIPKWKQLHAVTTPLLVERETHDFFRVGFSSTFGDPLAHIFCILFRLLCLSQAVREYIDVLTSKANIKYYPSRIIDKNIK